MADESSRRSSTKYKNKHFKPKHQKSKLFRANEPLLSVFMWGINHTVNELNHVNIPVMLMPDDFRAFTKVRVNNHLYQKDVMPSHFKVKEYCPLVFRNLRERFSIYESDYLRSLTKMQPVAVENTTKLYSTYDDELVLKILSSDEVENMHRLLKEYHPYIVERFSKTLLPQYLGMYRLTVDGQVTYFVVMRNIFSHLPIDKKYDLRDSNIDREAFIKDGAKLYLDLDTLIDTLEADTAFLARENLTDYCTRPCTLTFSYGRASKASCNAPLEVKGKNIKAAQDNLQKCAKANSLVSLGKYVPGSIASLDGGQSLFIANHAY